MTRPRARVRAFAADILLLAFAATVDGSAEGASIGSTVTDSDGHALADAVVSVTPANKGVSGPAGAELQRARY